MGPRVEYFGAPSCDVTWRSAPPFTGCAREVGGFERQMVELDARDRRVPFQLITVGTASSDRPSVMVLLYSETKGCGRRRAAILRCVRSTSQESVACTPCIRSRHH